MSAADQAPAMATPFPAPVERTMVISALAKVAGAQAEMARYLADGEAGLTFVFHDEVSALLAEGLRQILVVEQARFDAMAEFGGACTPAERESLIQLLASIEAFQKVWGRG